MTNFLQPNYSKLETWYTRQKTKLEIGFLTCVSKDATNRFKAKVHLEMWLQNVVTCYVSVLSCLILYCPAYSLGRIIFSLTLQNLSPMADVKMKDTHNEKENNYPLTVLHGEVDSHEIYLWKKHQVYTGNIYRDINCYRCLTLITFLSVCKQGDDYVWN